MRDLYDFEQNVVSRMNKNAVFTHTQMRTIDNEYVSRLGGRNSVIEGNYSTLDMRSSARGDGEVDPINGRM